MSKDQRDVFAGRQEAVALFENLCERQAGQPWSFQPVLTLVGPAGYGKSLFIQNLYFHHCNTPSLPHISLDFGRADAPRDLLNIFGALRNSLRRQRNARGHALAFSRFDILYSRLKRSEGQDGEKADEAQELFGEFSDLIGLLGNIHVLLGLLLFILKFIVRLPLLRSLLRRLVDWGYERAGKKPPWRWYQDQVKKFREINLPDNASASEIRSRLNEMCTIGGPEREFLIEQILPKAFLADLRYGDADSEAAMLKDGPRYVVIFLDSFEVLLRGAEPTAKQLLEALALNEYRKRGESDPLLLILASEERLPEMSREQLNQHFPSPPDTEAARQSFQQQATALHHDWLRRLPLKEERRKLVLRDIYLPLPLPTFTLHDTRDYLLRLDQRNETSIFANEALIEDIYRVTQGYPVFLSRVAALLQNFGPAVTDVREIFNSEQGEQILDRLLALHCKQVEERVFMLSAIPRTLTPELLGLVLAQTRPGPPDAHVLNVEWQRYRRLPFLLASEDRHSIIFVAGIRALFLQKLHIETAESDRDYLRMHQRLYDYFNKRIDSSLRDRKALDVQDQLERSYHALALGDYQSVVQLAIYAQQNKPDLWEKLLKVIAQAPTEKLPLSEIKQQASEGLYLARQRANTAESVPAAVRAIVLYTWLLAAPGCERKAASSLWYDLGTAYQYLQAVDPRVQRDKATRCFQRANELLNPLDPITVPPEPAEVRERQIPVPGRSFRRLVQSTYRSVRANRRVQILFALILVGAVLAPLLIRPFVALPRGIAAPANPFALPLANLQPDARHQWIGTTVESDGEFVGLSDGSVPFDYQRPDGSLKVRAATSFYQGNVKDALAILQEATRNDVNDAEAFIYQQNSQLRLSGQKCIIFVVATRIIEDSSEGVNNGRDNLQGAYVAQKEYNENNHLTPICIYVANFGNNPGHEPKVAQQIIDAANSNKSIKGIIGWPGLFDTPTSREAVSLLEKAHLPIVSPDNYDEVQFASNVFHIAPSRQDQGGKAAFYAGHVLHKTRAAIMIDPANPYSRCLTESFIQQFKEDGKQILAIQTYTTGKTDPQVLIAELQAEEKVKPDFIYFTGGIGEAGVLLAQLYAESSPLLLLGSEQLYPFIGFSVNARPGFDRLAFTSSAYADTPAASHMKALYGLAFDPQSQDPDRVREYGYRRPDSDAILSFDAMETLITAYTHAAGLQSIQQALLAVSVKGASHQLITFTALNELNDQSMFMLYTNKQGQISFSTV